MTAHLSREQLLRHLDGEMPPSEMRKTADHLHACWSCQVEFDRLKEQIATILDAQTALFEPALPAAPKPWPRLENRIERRQRLNSPPFWKNLFPFAGKPLWGQLAYGGAALVLAFIAISVWVSVTPVSAKQIVQRALVADAQRLAITGQQVVRQTVRVKKTARRSSTENLARLESWKSTRSTYWKSGADPVTAELRERYEANGLASALPLSPPAVQSWLAIAGAEPTASRHGDSTSVQAISNAQGLARGLEQVSFRVRPQQWHIDEITLSFEDATFQITEEESSVIARSEVPSDVMAVLEPLEARPSGVAANPKKPDLSTDSSVAAAQPVNLDELEMTVRYDLHSIGADLGEGVEISARPPGQVLVDARQVTPQMKERILARLANRPGVELDLESPGAGAAAQSVNKIIPQTAASPTPPDQRLVMFFGSAEVQENYTRLVLEANGNVLARLYALTNLAGRWPPELESRLSADAQTTLRTMVRDHAREALKGALGLEKQLDPLLKSFGYPVDTNVPMPAGAKWREASAASLDAAQREDRLLRSLLTHSDEPLSPDEAVPRLQQNLRNLLRSARELSAAAE